MAAPVLVELRAIIGDFQAKMAEARAEMAKTGEHAGGMGSKLATMGGGLVLGLGGAAIAVGGMALDMADKWESAHARLVVAIQNSGGQVGVFAGQIGKMQKQLEGYGYTNATVQSALATLTGATHDAGKATSDMALAANIAAGRHIDLATATDLVAKVETGHVALLGRLGIATKDASGHIISQKEALAKLSQMYAGDAAAAANTFGGKMAAVKALVEDLGAKLGLWLIPKIEELAKWFVKELPAAIAFVKGVILDVTPTIHAIGQAFSDVADWVGKLVSVFQAGGIGGLLSNIGQQISDFAPKLASQLGKWALAFIDWIGPMIPPLLVELGKLYLKLQEWIYTVALPKIVEQLGKWALAFIQWVGPMIPPLLVELGKLLVKVGDWLLTTALPKIVEQLAKWAAAFAEWVPGALIGLMLKLDILSIQLGIWLLTKALPDIVNKLLSWASAFAEWVPGAVLKLIAALPGIATALLDWAAGLPDKILTAVGDIASKMLKIGEQIVKGIINGIGNAAGGIASAIEHAIPGGGVVHSALHAIGIGATGGIVTHPTLAMIGEAGPEMVVPLNRTPGSSPLPAGGGGVGGSGMTYAPTYYVSGVSAADEFQAMLAQHDDQFATMITARLGAA